MNDSRQGFWPRLEYVAKFLCKLTGLIGALSLLAAALITTEGVVVRKVLGWSTIWQTEASVFLLMYACFVGAAFAQMHEHHLNIDLFIIYLPPRIRQILLVIAGILTCVVCLVIIVYAWPMWLEAASRNDHSESLWGPPLWIPYLFLPLGISLVLLQAVVQVRSKILELIRGTYEREVVRTELKDVPITATEGEDRSGGAHE